MSVQNYNIQEILKNSSFHALVKNIPHFISDMEGQVISSSKDFPKEGNNIFSHTIEYRGIPVITLRGINPKADAVNPYQPIEQIIYYDIKLFDKLNFLLAQADLEESSSNDLINLLNIFHGKNYNYLKFLEFFLMLFKTYVPTEEAIIFNVVDKNYLKNMTGTTEVKYEINHQTLIGIAALNQQSFISNTKLINSFYQTLTDYEEVNNLALFPIIHQNSLLGVLKLKNNLKGSYRPTDLSLIQRFNFFLAHIMYSKKQEEYLLNSKNMNTELGKYVSQNVKEDIENAGSSQKRGEGVKKKAVCLFCDIRSFTSISEKLEPAKLVSLLNIYFAELIPIVEKYEGTVDKLVGDMIAAFWNLPQDVQEAELKATKAAVEMQKAMIRKVVPAWAQAGVPRIGIGIGIYSGPVIAGNLGAKQFMNYTVIGDTVHNAEVLESMARPGEIFISEEIRKITDGKILKHERIENGITLKGLKKPAQAYVLKPIDYPDY